MTTTTQAYRTIDDVISRNKANGGTFFAPRTMAYWHSRVHTSIYPTRTGGAYFVTSEATSPDWRAGRRYAVRYVHPDGDVKTSESWIDWRSTAHRRAARWASERPAG